MPGARSRSFRIGDRAELLVQHLLAGLAFTTPVPRQEDQAWISPKTWKRRSETMRR